MKIAQVKLRFPHLKIAFVRDEELDIGFHEIHKGAFLKQSAEILLLPSVYILLI